MKQLYLFMLLISCCGFSQQKENLIIYFDSGSAAISDTEAEKITAFFENEEIEIAEVSISGFCDDIGSDDSNDVLSQNRAKSAAKLILDKFRIHANSVTGKGEIDLDSDFGQAEKKRSENRRVTISVSYFKNEIKTDEPKKEDEGYKTFEENLEVGDKVIIQHLLFDGSRTSFVNQEDAENELSKIVAYFHQNPSVEFQIQGHVCCITQVFKDARNIETGLNNLSKARAQKIYDFFVSKGIPKNRMTHEGYGRQFPRKGVAESLNKRVEIVITKI